MKIKITATSLLILFVLQSKGAFGQPLFSIEPYYFLITASDPPGMSFEYNVHSEFTNNTNDTLYIKWQVLPQEDCPAEWGIIKADAQLHWMTSVTTNIDSATMFYHPMPLAPQSMFNFFNLEIYPNQVAGCCTLQALFSLADDPDNIIDSVTYDIALLDTSCFVSANKEVWNDEYAIILPNPANDGFQIVSDEPITAVSLLNMSGNSVRKISPFQDQKIEVASLPSGMYLVKMELQHGKIGWKRVVVQH